MKRLAVSFASLFAYILSLYFPLPSPHRRHKRAMSLSS
jgi:hypothetical protein